MTVRRDCMIHQPKRGQHFSNRLFSWVYLLSELKVNVEPVIGAKAKKAECQKDGNRDCGALIQFI